MKGYVGKQISGRVIRLLRHFRAKPLLMKKSDKQQVEQLKKQLQEAQALVEKLQLKNTALETMINIAEKQLDIKIRKKSRAIS